MLAGYRNLKISKKLLLSNLAFALPMVVLIFFMNISFSYDINIGRTELAGTHYLRSLFLLLEHIPESLSSDVSQRTAASQKIQSIFSNLEAMPKEVASLMELEDNEEGLSLGSIQDQWQSLESGQVNSTEQEKLLNDIQELIALTGRNAKLVLDPALDSKILADLLVSMLPSHYNTLNRLLHGVSKKNSVGQNIPTVLVTEDSLFSDNFKNDFTLLRAGSEKIISEGKRVLAEDANFYGYSPSLHERFDPALEKYRQAVEEFSSMSWGIEKQAMPMATYLSAGMKVGHECRQLLLIGLDELDILIERRITSYKHWQFLGFACSAVALLLASFLIFSISKSITQPVSAIIKYTRKISDGEYKAPLAGDFQAELETLAGDLKGMVKKIVDLAAFPLENPTPVLAADMFGGILYTNPAATSVLEDLNINIHDFLPPNHKEIVAACLAGCRNCSETESEVQDLIFWWSYYPMVSQNIVHIYAHDITLQKQLAEQLQHDAFHDGLTGLPNRALFIDRLQQVLRKTAPLNTEFVVFYLDLDRFKLVNDSLGHETGDQLLIAVKNRIISLIKESDTLARLGGDEFALLIEDINIGQAVGMANRVLQGLKEPIHIGKYELSATSSIGIAVGRNSQTRAAEDILRDADTAMYRAKARGGDGYMVFEDTMHKNALARLELEVALKKGIERDEFVVFYQPIVDLNTAKIAGFEALVRWQHPEKGLVPPGVFIPLAEDTNLIVPLGKKILSMACNQARVWQKEIKGYEELMISVNLAVPQLASANLMEEIDFILLESDLPAHTLKIEITESGIMENVEESLAVLSEIKQRYITLGIDDFGTGYSSLSYLHRFPFDTLKVDRSFVVEMEKDEKNLEIIKTIVSLAHNLHKKVITEGIETRDQLEQIKQLGCEYGQGDYFAKPLPANEVENLLKEFSLV